ncbi:conjugal transfer protein TraH [Shewanella sp. UCD-KL12]|uniref:conjugal transfer protein TraH n=1 Tax=Shewanella sp. UCD-KL12 TaxID=1917163 RepID=UPI000970ECC6|nr:conjugal transfer protein TraH [Shewanella sp. UCD-KL12]
MKQLKISIVAFSMFVSPAYSDPMQTIFNDMYNATPPSFSQHGNGRYGVSFGSFSYRPNISQPANIVAARLPNFKMDDCGSIDMFAGSFSMISGDELSQMARAIMQGAATYAFDLALNSISPMAGDIKKELTKLITDMNKFSKNGCQMGRNMMMSAVGEENTTAITELKLMESQFSSIKSALGTRPDWFSAENDSNSIAENAGETAVSVDYNSTKAALDKHGAMGAFFESFGSMNRNELAMTFFGTTVTNTSGIGCSSPAQDGESTCISYYPAKGPSYFFDLFFDVQNFNNTSDVTITYYKCSNPQCTEITESTNTSKRFLPLIAESIDDLWDVMAKGDQALTQDQQILNYYLGNDMISNMVKFGTNSGNKEAYKMLKSLQMTRTVLEHLAEDMMEKTEQALEKEKSENQNSKVAKAGLPQSLKSVETFREQYQLSVKSKLKEHINEVTAQFANFYALKSAE